MRNVIALVPDGVPEELEALAGQWPAWFSCNVKGEVWAVHPGWGFNHPARRRYVTGECDYLDSILVPLILNAREGGGRFYVDSDGVYLAVDGTTVAEFRAA